MNPMAKKLRQAAKTIEQIKLRATLHADNSQEAPLSMVAALLIIYEAADYLDDKETQI